MAKIPDVENDFSKSSKEMNIPNQYDNVDWGARTKIVKRKVTSKSSGKDGTVFGSKAMLTKEHQHLTFKEYLKEAEDLTLLPDSVIGELKKNIKLGAKDLTQRWKDALELVRKAYQVSNVRIPLPVRKGAWAQFEMLIKFAVSELAKTRGLNGDWRTTNLLVKEAAEMDEQPVTKRRYFITVPGETSVEINHPDQTMDEVLMDLVRKLRNKGMEAVITRRGDDGIVLLDVYKRDSEGNRVKRDTIRVQEI